MAEDGQAGATAVIPRTWGGRRDPRPQGTNQHVQFVYRPACGSSPLRQNLPNWPSALTSTRARLRDLYSLRRLTKLSPTRVTWLLSWTASPEPWSELAKDFATQEPVRP